MRPKINGLAIATLSVFILLLVGIPTSSEAFDFPVWLRNDGDVDLHYGVLWTSSGIFGLGSGAKIAGFYKLAPGKSHKINGDYDLLAIALFQYDEIGNFVNVQYKNDKVKKVDWTMDWICLKHGLEEKGAKSDIVSKYTPPCPEGHIKASTSFYIGSSVDGDIHLEVQSRSVQ